MKKLLFSWNELKATFWLVPVLILISSIFVAISLVYIDSLVTISHNRITELFFVTSSNSARSILSTISGAMIGVAGTVFSITLVALTLASSQFGPRLIRNFMYVRLNQIVLGSYIATYMYCLLVLNTIRDYDGYTFIPSISIFVAILAALINILLLIIFIHRIAVSIQADHIITEISDFIINQVEEQFKKSTGEELEIEESFDLDLLKSKYHHIMPLQSPRNGYLQYLDTDSMVKIISESDMMLEMNYRSGDHLVKNMVIGLLFSNTKIENDTTEDLLDSIVIGKGKTAQQDIEYSIQQMVEIAVRALSSGINDPFTAISCIDNLTSVICYLLEFRFPSKYNFDGEGSLRLVANSVDFERTMDTAFNQIRQNSARSTSVIISLIKAMNTIRKMAKNENQKTVVTKHANMIKNLGKEMITEPNDLKAFNASYKQLIDKE